MSFVIRAGVEGKTVAYSAGLNFTLLQNIQRGKNGKADSF